jgi:acyl carrier protein
MICQAAETRWIVIASMEAFMTITQASMPEHAADTVAAAPAPTDQAGIDTIVADLLDIIRRHTKSAGEGWTAATTLEDVGIDSFDLVELIFEIEDKYDVSVNFNANRTADDFKTVLDVARVIQDTLNKAGQAA